MLLWRYSESLLYSSKWAAGPWTSHGTFVGDVVWRSKHLKWAEETLFSFQMIWSETLNYLLIWFLSHEIYQWINHQIYFDEFSFIFQNVELHFVHRIRTKRRNQQWTLEKRLESNKNDRTLQRYRSVLLIWADQLLTLHFWINSVILQTSELWRKFKETTWRNFQDEILIIFTTKWKFSKFRKR